MLAGIQRRIRTGYAVVQPLSGSVLTDADAQCNRSYQTVRFPVTVSGALAHPFWNLQRLLAVGVGQHRKNLIAAPATNIIFFPQRQLKQPTDLAHYPIAM